MIENLEFELLPLLAHSSYRNIELFELALKNKHETDDRFAWRTEEKSIKFIVNSYNGLNQNTNEAKMARQKVLLMFDTLLQNYRYRTNSDKILEELI
jgi:competence transcription factor ComK